MSIETLIARLEERVKVLRASDPKFSERAFLRNAELDEATLRRIRDRRQVPSPAVLARLEGAFGTAPGYLIEAVTGRTAVANSLALEAVYVRGAVQAGVWREAVEWASAEWFPIMVPTDKRLPANVERFGLLVRGNSMDRLYPEGTVVVVVRYHDLRRQPRPGDRVVVLRRNPRTFEFEATLKELQIDKDGRVLLWPRSSAPEFQAPFIIHGEPQVNRLEGSSPADFVPNEGEDNAELIITGFVIGSYRPEDTDPL
ncbi:S24 family peptidase [Pararoseomonas sp. SCSIO 73927]|uniref:LexA family protein n=1 Tax=Pararoseomonas sp. SCSIO 73927 TaxID=3114537 RepID=UPI0030CC9A32